MAYGSAEIPAAEVALFEADKPVVMGKNYVRDAGDIRWTTGGTQSSSDLTSANGPTSYLQDDFDHLQSYPNATAGTWYLNIDFGSGVLAEVDHVALKNHNLYSQGVTGVSVQFDQNQNGNFTGVDTAPLTTPTSDYRLVELDLKHTGTVERRYTDVRYLRLAFLGSAIQPSIGEISIGFRRQLKHNPTVGVDRLQLVSNIRQFTSESGVSTSYSLNRNRQYLNAELRMSEDSYIAAWEAFFRDDTNGGTYPWWWVWDPSSDPEPLWVKFLDTSLVGPSEGYTERMFSFSAAEQGPNFLANGDGV